MLITITAASILAISVFAWLAKRVLRIEICPVCAGVLLTWIGLVGAYFAGYRIDPVIPALLMGGSVVGIAYQLEKKLRSAPTGAPLLFKMLFIPAGFVSAYAVLEQEWAVLLFATAFLLLLPLLFFGKTGPRPEGVGDIEKRLKDCC
ncbi:hypothetical protein HY972_00540 [Candidatus Kaiserbacteria bacterium]|nr:hypothetical protein [Candidatus Kaiserbacteria bacterium]